MKTVDGHISFHVLWCNVRTTARQIDRFPRIVIIIRNNIRLSRNIIENAKNSPSIYRVSRPVKIPKKKKYVNQYTAGLWS